MVARKVANPAPAMLALVNPKKRGRKMATKKRRTRRKVARVRSHSTVARRHTARRHTAKRRTSRRRVYASRSNPVHRRRRNRVHHRRRHVNPLRGAGGEIANFTVAGLSLGMAQPILTRFVGGMLPFGQYNAPILSAGTGWVLSKVFEMFSFTRRFAHPTMVFGFATAAMQVLQPIVRGAIGAGGGGSPMQGWGGGQYGNWSRRPMRGLGVTTNIPPVTRQVPAMPPQANGGMNGLGMRPGQYAGR